VPGMDVLALTHTRIGTEASDARQHKINTPTWRMHAP
jgi:hypothetical protein